MQQRDTTADLLARIEKLERHNRILGYAAAALVLLAAAHLWVAWSSGPAGDVMLAESFMARDMKGEIVARLGSPAGRPGTGQLHLGALENGMPDPSSAVTLQGGSMGAQVNLHGRSGRLALRLGEDSRTRGGFIQLYDGQENLRVALGLRLDGSPMLLFLDEKGNVTWQAPGGGNVHGG